MDLGLSGKVAFVAGSTRGIGLAIGRAFLREGARVVLTGREKIALDHARDLLSPESERQQALFIQGDMTQPDRIRAALQETGNAFGRIDTVISNVGNGTAKGGWDLSLEDWQSALDTNLLGGMALASAVLPGLAERGSGNLVFISSIAGCEAIGAPVTYGASKAALLSAVKSLSRLAGPSGVRVNAVAPGNVFFPGGAWERKLAERREHFERYIQSEVPLQRFGTPEEIADAVVFLASERAAFITGACLVVDGGQTRSL